MAGPAYSDDLETLFSFELLVEYIRVEKVSQVSDDLALGVRLLDFPTLLVHRPQRSGSGIKQRGQQGEHAFNRGKSCFFKMNGNSLHANLSSTPLYVMVLDVKEDIPKLLGSSLISLARAMDRIRQDVAKSNDKKERHGESNQVGSQAEADRHREKIDSLGSGRHSTPKSSFSDSSGEGNEEADYADDFNSFELSEAFSPDPLSSPESSGAKSARSPVRLDFCNSDSDHFRRRAVLPVPIKAPGSPQRALRATHVIRPRTHASALSFSSEDGDGNGSGSLRTVRSRKTITTDSGRVEGGSGSDCFVSSRGQRGRLTKDSGHSRGFSAESVSSVEPREVEELEDELGSLDFKKEYRHISELVVNKLPGYTM
ncbi:Microtubule-associated protein 10 [Liparis tanakae]|uniref:Microtubule-associated protein 10 n=1 Tax=Liparis tanakae TaxID=230148 RepID=A0A4Z2GZS0_9TELE|nr:Microtubule-associated protein 10 [Liparis tanakae]